MYNLPIPTFKKRYNRFPRKLKKSMSYGLDKLLSKVDNHAA